jgi:hypothetical membrane protein
MQQFKLEHTTITKIAGICGILVPIVVFTCIGLALSYSPWFDWTYHALSDLGVVGTAAPLFNTGMILGGFLLFIFSLGLMKVLSYKIGVCILCLSSLALIGIGMFPETVFTLHLVVSISFFVLLTISLLVIGLKIKQDPSERNMGLLAIFFAMMAICSTVFLIPYRGIAISESITCFPAFIWCMIYGAKMTFGQSRAFNFKEKQSPAT